MNYAACATGDLRLTGGSNEYEGRVEICMNGVWGSVSDYGWDGTDASVVCRQLQYYGIIIMLVKIVYMYIYIQVVRPFLIHILGLEQPPFIYIVFPVIPTLLVF